MILRTTYNPAKMIGCDHKFGGLRPGIDEDAAVFELRDESVRYVDSYGDILDGKVRLMPVHTIRRGKLMQAQ